MKHKLLLALLAAPFAVTAALAAPPAAFLANAVATDNAEVAAGQLARTRGASTGVKRFGAQLVADHGSHKRKVQDLARRLHLRVPDTTKPADRAAAARLSRLSGRAFDREFATHMVAGHRQAIAQYEAQARTGDRQTRQLAQQTLPTLREHLRIAQSLAR